MFCFVLFFSFFLSSISFLAPSLGASLGAHSWNILPRYCMYPFHTKIVSWFSLSLSLSLSICLSFRIHCNPLLSFFLSHSLSVIPTLRALIYPSLCVSLFYSPLPRLFSYSLSQAPTQQRTCAFSNPGAFSSLSHTRRHETSASASVYTGAARCSALGYIFLLVPPSRFCSEIELCRLELSRLLPLNSLFRFFSALLFHSFFLTLMLIFERFGSTISYRTVPDSKRFIVFLFSHSLLINK